MERLKVTREWLETQDACSTAVSRFVRRWPGGLTVNRRNLYMAAKVLPVDDILWLSHRLLHPNNRSGEGFYKCCDISTLAETASGNQVRTQAKRHAYAKALADAAGL